MQEEKGNIATFKDMQEDGGDEPGPDCKECEDEGVITKTEWFDEDNSYDVIVKCKCNED